MGPVGSKRYVNVVCFDFAVDNGGETGKPYVALSLRGVDGPDAGRNFSKRGYLTEKAAPITLEQLRALGWTGTKLSKAMAEGLGSLKANAQLTVKERNGKTFEEVTGIYAPRNFGARVDNALDESGAAAFDALFEDVAAGIEVAKATDANKAPAELPAPVAAAARPVVAAAVDDPFGPGF